MDAKTCKLSEREREIERAGELCFRAVLGVPCQPSGQFLYSVVDIEVNLLCIKTLPPAINFTWQWKITHLYDIEMINSYFPTTVEIDEDRNTITILNHR
jgi:hypothetical protein